MFLDALLTFSDSQAFAAAGNATNWIDLGNATVKRRIGGGEPVGVGIFVEVAATGGPLTFNVVDSPNADLSAPTTIATGTFTAANLAIGTRHWIGIPKNQGRQRYLGLAMAGTGTVTVTATLMPQRDFEEWVTYANAYDA